MFNTRPKVSCCNIVHIGYASVRFLLGMSILFCLSPFCLQWVPNINVVSGGMWSLLCLQYSQVQTFCITNMLVSKMPGGIYHSDFDAIHT